MSRSLAAIPFAAAVALAMGMAAAPVTQAEPARPLSVVELFTSQGCSSCPPANENVAKISARPDVIALSFGVTYWDQLGWKDTFASPQYTARQYAYARSLHHDGPFTPQVVVDGKADVVGAEPGEIEALVARTRITGPEIAVNGDAVQVGAGSSSGPAADVWLVRYDPRTVQVPVRAGENTGRTLPHKNVVKSLVRLGGWRGAAARFVLPPAVPGLAAAVLVQAKDAGAILAAARG
jgi:hypothetical protein